MKILYYSPISWQNLDSKPPSFPHSNEYYDPKSGIRQYDEAIELFLYAERVGFDWLGVGEEHMNVYGVVPNPCLIGAALARLTHKAMICILGNPLPLLNPIRVAEEYAMIDILSGGRLVAGFPRGVPQNYAAYGLNSENSMEQLYEAVSFVLNAWKNKGPFDWVSKHYNFSNVSIWPQPTKQPELVFSSKSLESVTLAVEHKGILAELYVKNKTVLEHFIKSKLLYEDLAKKRGWQSDSENFLINVPCFIGSSDETAKEKALSALSYVSNVISGSFEPQKKILEKTYYKDVNASITSGSNELIEDRIEYGGIICGCPSTVIEQILQLKNATGAGILGLQMQIGNITYKEVRESLYLFGKYVKPYIKK
ncbi:alkanal monooxygenase alpha chain [mine drainage metagenome]|uniref:Alkanal monooxygenase alpha chain n=1 Tax=mine drainage metagenome TaxID=410659 RepID=A0A1J5PYG9_9ZZZZ